MQQHCPSLADLDRRLLADVDRALGLRLDGNPLAASTASRYRKVAHACIRRAVDLEILDRDPWPPPNRGAAQRKSRKISRAVDVKALPDPVTMRKALAAISTHQPASVQYEVMTSVMYYAGLRPSEVVMLRPRNLVLPRTGWGKIDVVEADISFDESGAPKTGERTVPIPPELVKLDRDPSDETRRADVPDAQREATSDIELAASLASSPPVDRPPNAPFVRLPPRSNDHLARSRGPTW